MVAEGSAHEPRFAPPPWWQLRPRRGKGSIPAARHGTGAPWERRVEGRDPAFAGLWTDGGAIGPCWGPVRSCLGVLGVGVGVDPGSCRPVELLLERIARLVALEVRIRRRSGRRDPLGLCAHRKPAQDRGCRVRPVDGPELPGDRSRPPATGHRSRRRSNTQIKGDGRRDPGWSRSKRQRVRPGTQLSTGASSGDRRPAAGSGAGQASSRCRVWPQAPSDVVGRPRGRVIRRQSICQRRPGRPSPWRHRSEGAACPPHPRGM